MKYNIIQEKSFLFARKIIHTYKKLTATNKEYILSKQLLRSGTAIGANIEEAIGAQSTKDFISKLSISYKEARETKYWLRLLEAENYLDTSDSQQLLESIEEILRILGAIQRTQKIKNS